MLCIVTDIVISDTEIKRTVIVINMFGIPGAQSVGCRFDKKPQYRYSGCHGQDASALSIVLGLRSGFEESAYVVRARARWRSVSAAAARAELRQLLRNSTEDYRTDHAAAADALTAHAA